MKFKINQEDFDKLSESLQGEYTKGDDGEFTLKIEGGEDTGALKRAKDHEKKRRQDSEAKLKEAQDTLTEVQSELEDLKDNSDKNGDAALEKKWQRKLEAKEAELNTTIDGLKGNLSEILVDGVASTMASALSDSPSLLLPQIKNRLTVEMVDGKPVTKVKDIDGELSALTVEELQTEMSSNKEFAAIIRGSGASGGGAEGDKGGDKGGKPEKPDFSKASSKEIAEYLKSQKEAT